MSGELKSIARMKLKGNLRLSVVVSFIALLLGDGSLFDFGVKITYHEKFTSLKFKSFITEFIHMIKGIDINSIISEKLRDYIIIILLVNIMVFLGLSFIELGKVNFYIKQMRSGQGEFKDFIAMFSYVRKAFYLRILMSIFIFLWSCLFVIPGIIAAIRYSFAMYALADNPELGAFEAIDVSKQLTKGRKFDIFLLNLSFMGWIIVNIFTAGLASFVLNPYYEATYASLYLFLNNEIDLSGEKIVYDVSHIEQIFSDNTYE